MLKLDKKWIPETLEEALLYRRVIAWDEDSLTLDNGNVLTIEMTDSDCCAWAGGKFTNVELDAVVTAVESGEPEKWEDSDTYGSTLIVKIYHNQNPIAQADMTADAGNGGYYYSVASLIVTTPVGNRAELIHVVS